MYCFAAAYLVCAHGTTGSGAVGRGLQSEDAVVVFARSCGSVCNKQPIHACTAACNLGTYALRMHAPAACNLSCMPHRMDSQSVPSAIPRRLPASSGPAPHLYPSGFSLCVAPFHATVSLSLSLSLSWTLFRDTSKPAGPSPPYPPLRVPLSPRWRRGRRPGPVALPGGGDQATRYYPLGLH